MFSETLHVGRPNIGSRSAFNARMEDILDRAWLTNNGVYVQEFESKLCDLLGVRNCCAISNGTVALEIAIRALGMKGEVIVPSFTFAATAHCLQWQEITPVFCDIDPVTHSIDVNKIESLITPKTTGILAVHLWGVPCNIEKLTQIASKHGLRLLFDAAHALGASYQGEMIGNFGDAEVLSFHATKIVNSFEGGAICTNDDDMAEKIRLMKNFGFAGLDNVIYLGTNGKMSEPSAAMGLTSLESMEDFIAHNERNYASYLKCLENVPGCRQIRFDSSEKYNFQYIVLEIEEGEFGLSRDFLINILHAENVRARRYFYPGVHRMEPYRSNFPNAGVLLPETNHLVKKTLCLPNGTSVSVQQTEDISRLLDFVSSHSDQILNELPGS